MNNKLIAFEYLTNAVLKWKAEVYNTEVIGVRLSKTQVLKLLFLVSAVPSEEGGDLLDIFNNFYALQFGPVESDVLDYITAGRLSYLETADNMLSIGESTFDSLDRVQKSRIDKAVFKLRSQNSDLVKYSATDLVEITHKWWCWKQAFQVAQLLNKGSFPMSIDSIRQSNKVYA